MRNEVLVSILLAGCFTALAACGDDGGDGNGDPDAAPMAECLVAEPSATCPEPTSVLPNEWRPINAVSAGAITDMGGGLILVDATAGGPANAAENPFLYIRFNATADKLELTDTQSFESCDWDLAIKRAVLRVNSGDSGPGEVTVAAVGAATLAEVTEPPVEAAFRSDDWATDACELVAGNLGEPLTAVGDWYNYDVMTNQLDPMELVYVIRRPGGEMVKLKINNYYDVNGAGANYEIEWAPLP